MAHYADLKHLRPNIDKLHNVRPTLALRANELHRVKLSLPF